MTESQTSTNESFFFENRDAEFVSFSSVLMYDFHDAAGMYDSLISGNSTEGVFLISLRPRMNEFTANIRK